MKKINKARSRPTAVHVRPARPTINLAIDASLLDAFEQVASQYGHGKQKGQVLSAALLMFLEADPREQARCVRAVFESQVDQGMQALLEQARARQTHNVTHRDERTGHRHRPRLAAKKATPARKAIRALPTLPGAS